MITKQHLLNIYQTLTSDETFCRLALYGDDWMDTKKEDISTSPKKDAMMKEIIWYSPQTEDLAEKEENRIMIYKSLTTVKQAGSVVRDEIIRIDLFIPHRLVREDFRIYELENNISYLLDGKYIRGLGNLQYVDGRFLDSPVRGFALYRMLFAIKQGRDING